MEQERVTVYLVLGPLDSVTWTWTPPTNRWRARDMCRDFAHGVQWDGRPVLRALIVDLPKEKT